jgi:transcriptional regulator with XRE-family HTH domain
MKFKSVQKKIDRTPEELARLKAIREKFQQQRPTLEQLVQSGETDEPIPLGAYLETKVLLHRLKKERANAGLSLAEVAKRSGMDKAAISRLENGRQANPTMETLWRFAMAVGKQIVWDLADLPDAGIKAGPAPKIGADSPQDAAARSPRSAARAGQD